MTQSVRTLLLAAVVAVAAAATLASAQTLNVKLGLWEVTSTNQMSGMPAMPNVDTSKMPPEQRERVEQMMKAREGMMSGGGKPTVTKQCVTKEKLEKQFFEERETDPSCKRTVLTSSASVQEFKIECTGDRKMSGTARFEALSPEAVKGTMHFNAEAEGRPITINSNIAGRWVAADCGDVK